MTDRLAQMGRPGVKLDNALVEPLLCKQVRAASAVKDAGRFTSYAELSAVHERVRPIADSYIGAVGVAETSAGGVHNRDLKGRLLTRPLGEQILRRGMSWGSGAMAHMPRLNEEERAILSSLLLIQTQQRDVWNTAWLRDVVDKEGWPTISDVGPDAAQQAWLIAQHADQDPVFQLQALQMMEPLVDAGEVSKPDFAYLYDRIMLKLVGKQRYATQMTCRDGKRQPQPLEDAPAVNEWRQSANLGSLEDYLDTMNRRFGPCPAE